MGCEKKPSGGRMKGLISKNLDASAPSGALAPWNGHVLYDGSGHVIYCELMCNPRLRITGRTTQKVNKIIVESILAI